MKKSLEKLETFEDIGEELRQKEVKLKNAQRRMKIWTTKFNNLNQEVKYLKRKLNESAPGHIKKIVDDSVRPKIQTMVENKSYPEW